MAQTTDHDRYTAQSRMHGHRPEGAAHAQIRQARPREYLKLYRRERRIDETSRVRLERFTPALPAPEAVAQPERRPRRPTRVYLAELALIHLVIIRW